MKDFEDAVQASAAELNEIENVITRKVNDYSKSRLKIYTPKEFLKQLKYVYPPHPPSYHAI